VERAGSWWRADADAYGKTDSRSLAMHSAGIAMVLQDLDRRRARHGQLAACDWAQLAHWRAAFDLKAKDV
jgi:hypothetical protein